jgi:hypothetical protein
MDEYILLCLHFKAYTNYSLFEKRQILTYGLIKLTNVKSIMYYNRF